EVDDVGDMRVEIDIGTHQVRPLTESRQRRRPHVVAGIAQQPSNLLVAPATVPAAVHQNVRRHNTLQPASPSYRSSFTCGTTGTTPAGGVRSSRPASSCTWLPVCT